MRMTAFIMAVAITIAVVNFSQAADADGPAQTFSVYGKITVLDKANRSLTVSHYDVDKKVKADDAFILDPQIESENIPNLNDLKIGDWVLVKYVKLPNVNIAKYISVDLEDVITKEKAETIK